MSLMLTENGGKSRVFGNMSFHAHCKNQTTDLEVRGWNPLGRATKIKDLVTGPTRAFAFLAHSKTQGEPAKIGKFPQYLSDRLTT